MAKLVNCLTGKTPFMACGVKFFPGVAVEVSDAVLAAIVRKFPNMAETPLRDPASAQVAESLRSEVATLSAGVPFRPAAARRGRPRKAGATE